MLEGAIPDNPDSGAGVSSGPEQCSSVDSPCEAVLAKLSLRSCPCEAVLAKLSLRACASHALCVGGPIKPAGGGHVGRNRDGTGFFHATVNMLAGMLV